MGQPSKATAGTGTWIPFIVPALNWVMVGWVQESFPAGTSGNGVPKIIFNSGNSIPFGAQWHNNCQPKHGYTLDQMATFLPHAARSCRQHLLI